MRGRFYKHAWKTPATVALVLLAVLLIRPAGAAEPATLATDPAPPGVLIFHSNQRPTAAGIVIEDTLRAVVRAALKRPVGLYSEYLDETVEFINELLVRDAVRPEFLSQFDVKHLIRIPRAYPNSPDRGYYIPFIEMSAELQAKLDYESKLDRSPENIGTLMADGERQARVFLKERAARPER